MSVAPLEFAVAVCTVEDGERRLDELYNWKEGITITQAVASVARVKRPTGHREGRRPR
jgi:hypothetical protein